MNDPTPACPQAATQGLERLTHGAQEAQADDLERSAVALVMDFFAALDRRSHAEVAAWIAPEGTWHRQGRALTGPEAVRAALDARPAGRSTCHVITNVRMRRRDGQRVHLTYYLTAYEAIEVEAPAPRLAAILECEDVIEHLAQGVRIVEKTSRRLLPPEAPAGR